MEVYRSKKIRPADECNLSDDRMKSSINVLNDHTLMETFEHLSLEQCFDLRIVCKRWKVLLEDVLKHTETVSTEFARMNNNWWKSCRDISHLRSIDISRTTLFYSLLASSFVYTPRLKAIYIHCYEIDEKFMEMLCDAEFFRSRTLEHLEITNCTFSKFVSLSAADTWNDFFFNVISSLKHFIFTNNTGILPPTSKWMQCLAKSNRLEMLVLELSQFDGRATKILKDISISNLQSFQLSNSSACDLKYLNLNLFKNLVVLNFQKILLSIQQLQALKENSPNLKFLNFCINFSATASMIRAGECIFSFQKLEKLKITSPVELNGWFNLFNPCTCSPLYDLREIILIGLGFSDNFGLGLVKNCPNLQKFVFFTLSRRHEIQRRLDEKDVVRLIALPHVREITLVGFKIQSRALEQLLTIFVDKTKLRKLQISFGNKLAMNTIKIFNKLAQKNTNTNYELTFVENEKNHTNESFPFQALPNLKVRFDDIRDFSIC